VGGGWALRPGSDAPPAPRQGAWHIPASRVPASPRVQGRGPCGKAGDARPLCAALGAGVDAGGGGGGGRLMDLSELDQGKRATSLLSDVRTHARSLARTRARRHTRKRARTHARKHARTHARTHASKHSRAQEQIERCGRAQSGTCTRVKMSAASTLSCKASMARRGHAAIGDLCCSTRAVRFAALYARKVCGLCPLFLCSKSLPVQQISRVR
jgi:hypothetical protein